MLAQAKFPGGETKTLLHISRWDLNWQLYSLRGSRQSSGGHHGFHAYRYDNSAANPANPNMPPKRVLAGNRASDEMAHLWLQVCHSPPGETQDPRRILQEAIARHHVENNPSDFEAHYNLAAMLQARGELAQSITHYNARSRSGPGTPRGKTPWAAHSSPRENCRRPSHIFPSPYKPRLLFRSALQSWSRSCHKRPISASNRAIPRSGQNSGRKMPMPKQNLRGALAANGENTGSNCSFAPRPGTESAARSCSRNLETLLKDTQTLITPCQKLRPAG